MLKQISFVIFVLLAFGSNAQNVTFNSGRNQNYWSPNSGQYDIHLKFTNKTGSSSRVVYQKVAVDWPSSWIVQFCDDVNCHTTFVDGDTFQSIANNGEGDIHITVYPQGNADTATFTYLVYAAGTPAQKDTATVNVYIPWGANSKGQAAARVSLYPNPANSVLTLATETAGTLTISNLQGRQLHRSYANRGINSMDVASLPAGVYNVSLTTATGVIRKQFVKI